MGRGVAEPWDRLGEAAAGLHVKAGLKLDVADLRSAARLGAGRARLGRIARPFLPKLVESRTFIVKAGLIGGGLGFGKSRRLRVATNAFDAGRRQEIGAGRECQMRQDGQRADQGEIDLREHDDLRKQEAATEGIGALQLMGRRRWNIGPMLVEARIGSTAGRRRNCAIGGMSRPPKSQEPYSNWFTIPLQVYARYWAVYCDLLRKSPCPEIS